MLGRRRWRQAVPERSVLVRRAWAGQGEHHGNSDCSALQMSVVSLKCSGSAENLGSLADTPNCPDTFS